MNTQNMHTSLIHLNNTYQHIGLSSVFAAAYDTAWLARVPLLGHLNQPAFPEALNWLRENQLSDGSFGTAPIYSASANTLSTLAALLAFRQWNQAQDATRIQQALDALEPLAKKLKYEPHETIGFEMLLPALLRECQGFGLSISPSLYQLYQPYLEKAKTKEKIIHQFYKKNDVTKPAPWWFNLEMHGGDVMRDASQQRPIGVYQLCPQGSVIGSPAATAYLLAYFRYRSQDLPVAEHYLRHVIKVTNEQGAVPNVYPIDEFEQGFCANYLLDSEVPSSYPIIIKLMRNILSYWQNRQEKGFGYSTDVLFTDPDCTSNGVRAMLLAGYKNIKPETLLRFYNGTCIETFTGELSASLSTNIHVLSALRLMTSTPEIENCIHQLQKWLGQQLKANKGVFSDKWHFSPFYPMARAIIALEGINDDVSQSCADWLVEQQYNNGGWGYYGYATPEESAFALHALSYYAKTKTLDTAIFQKGLKFLKATPDIPYEALWIGKVFYGPKAVVSSIRTAACIGAEKALEHAANKGKLSVVSEEKSLEMMNKLEPSQFVPFADYQVDEVHHSVYEHTMNWAKQFQIAKIDNLQFYQQLAEASNYAVDSHALNEQKLYLDFALFMLMLDDLIDEDFNVNYFISYDELKTCLHYIFFELSFTKISKIPRLLFDKIEPYKQAWSNLIERLELNLEFKVEMNRCVKKFIHATMKEFIYTQNKSWNLWEYLKIRSIAGGTDLSCMFSFLIHKLHLEDQLKNNNDFKKLKKYAYKALILANDILSLHKEQHEKYQKNCIIMLEQQLHLSRQEAIQSCLEAYNQNAIHFQHLQDKVKNQWRDEQMNLATEIIAHHIQAHLHWGLETQRYYIRSQI